MTKAETLREFIRSATDARNGQYGRAKALVDSVRREEGDREASAMRAEIWRYVQMPEPDWIQAKADVMADIE